MLSLLLFTLTANEFLPGGSGTTVKIQHTNNTQIHFPKRFVVSRIPDDGQSPKPQ
jgi:hypothetical protein